MSADLVFYTNPQSRGRIVRWMLEEVSVPYDTRVLEYGTSMKASEYLAINPMGKVPAITHAGNTVTECAATVPILLIRFPKQAWRLPWRTAPTTTAGCFSSQVR